jgi:hypothetical protein
LFAASKVAASSSFKGKKVGRFMVRQAFRKNALSEATAERRKAFLSGSVSCDLNERSGLRKARSTRVRVRMRARFFFIYFTCFRRGKITQLQGDKTMKGYRFMLKGYRFMPKGLQIYAENYT